MPSDSAKRAEQQRLRRARQREEAAQAAAAQPDDVSAGDAPASAPSAWQHARPPQLLKDFGRKSGRPRLQYEAARDAWYQQETGSQLPPFNPKGSAEEQQAQVEARAWPWQQATKAYKDTYVRKRRRPTSVDVQALDAGTWAVQDNSKRIAAAVKRRRLKQQCAWVEEVRALARQGDAEVPAEEDWPLSTAPWPECQWREDAWRIGTVSHHVEQHPPTGERSWWDEVETVASGLHRKTVWNTGHWPHLPKYLPAGYYTLFLLPSTPRSLRLDRSKEHVRVLSAMKDLRQQQRFKLLYETSTKPDHVRVGIIEQRLWQGVRRDAPTEAEVLEEQRWRAGRALMTVCRCNHCVRPRDTLPCFLHTHVREYVHALDDCSTDDRYNAEAMREVRRLHSVAMERGGSILNGNIVVDVDDQLQPYHPLRLRARICPGAHIVREPVGASPLLRELVRKLVKERDLRVK